jgi:sigma-E factor negative regulatory protein RseB
MVFSDGLASISVFIEPSASRNRVNPVASRQGAINIYTRTLDDQVVTVLGEAPAPAVQQIGESVAVRGK